MDYQVSEAQFNEMVEPLLQRMVKPIERALRDGRLHPDDLDDIVLVGGSSRLKCVRRMVAQTFKWLSLPGIHPDETIALGAAIQAGFKSREQCLKDIVMTDVTPYTLGIEVNEQFSSIIADKLFAPIIERNATVPISRSKTFWTLHDNQKKIQVSVYQGERPDVKDNIFG